MQTNQTPTEGNHSANQETEVALDDATCSRSVLQSLVDAIDQFSGGASMMHPRLTRALTRAKDHLRGTNEREGNHYRYVVERRRADLDGNWERVGNEYSTLKRAEKEARWERASRKGMQSRIIHIPANAKHVRP